MELDIIHDLQWFLSRIGKNIYREESHIPAMEVRLTTELRAKICHNFQSMGVFKYNDIKK